MRGLEQVTAATTIKTDQMDKYLSAKRQRGEEVGCQTDQIDQHLGDNRKEARTVFQQIAELDKATGLKLRHELIDMSAKIKKASTN